jgi:hypothetical protein
VIIYFFVIHVYKNFTTTDFKYLKFRSSEFHAFTILVVGFYAQHRVVYKFVYMCV